MFKYMISKLKSNRGFAGDGSEEKTDASDQGTDKVEGIVQDLDFSDVPENIRKDVIKYTTQKTKLYDAGFRTKTEEVSKLKKDLEEKEFSLRDLTKLRDEIQGNPEMEKAVTKAINDVRAGKSTKTINKDLKKLDQLIENTDDASTREQLKQMRDIIKEETGADSLKEKIKSLEDQIASLKTTATVGIDASINNQRAKLEDRYGKDLVAKNWDKIKVMALKHTSYVNDKDFPKILLNVADSSEIEDALLDRAKQKQTEELDRKKKGSSFNGEATVSKVDLPRDKGGRVIWTGPNGALQKLKDAGKF